MHPSEFVTVKLYVPAASNEIVVLVPEPVIDPGFIVQFPEGNPLNITLPVATAHVGCVTVNTFGAAGVTGCTLITTADVPEVHPTEFVTLK